MRLGTPFAVRKSTTSRPAKVLVTMSPGFSFRENPTTYQPFGNGGSVA
jgi:hypothetical protein